MLNGYGNLSGGEYSLEADRIPSLKCGGELLKQKTGFSGITGDVIDASANLLNQLNCLLVPLAGCFNGHGRRACVTDHCTSPFS